MAYIAPHTILNIATRLSQFNVIMQYFIISQISLAIFNVNKLDLHLVPFPVNTFLCNAHSF